MIGLCGMVCLARTETVHVLCRSSVRYVQHRLRGKKRARARAERGIEVCLWLCLRLRTACCRTRAARATFRFAAGRVSSVQSVSQSVSFTSTGYEGGGGGVSVRAHTLAAFVRWVAFGPSEDERLGTRWCR